ncbi:MAG: 4Fe-4S binding protein [Chloroflexi bacterium]|nr:4Fe-4S binding protein [Chloroflexota bacterium]
MKIGSMLKDVLISFFSAPITEKYPFERPETADRFRGKLFYDPAKCTGCNLCSKDCPAKALEIVVIDRAAKRFVARYDMDKCVYCAQCIQSCKFKCIGMSNEDWELAALTKELFTVTYGKEEDIARLLEGNALPNAEPIKAG